MASIRRTWLGSLILAVNLVFAGGCTGPIEFVQNGFKVGPNYTPPQACVSRHWIEGGDKVREGSDLPCHWWTVFQDPDLEELIRSAANQNLTLREAGFRILEARAALGIARGELFPQRQGGGAGYQRIVLSGAKTDGLTGTHALFFDEWGDGFNLVWEIDFWGRFRRAVTAAEDTLDASVAGYDEALVTLYGDVASAYVAARTLERRIQLYQRSVERQTKLRDIASRRLKEGKIGRANFATSQGILEQTKAAIPPLEAQRREAYDVLCVLLGWPPFRLDERLHSGNGVIPRVPASVAVGIPADLLRRRPDVRVAERRAAARAEQIGIAEADLYPAISIQGTLGYLSMDATELFTGNAMDGNVGPQISWKILNYGRILNNERLQEATFQASVTAYQAAVLQAQAEVETGLVSFIQAQEALQYLDKSVQSFDEACTKNRRDLLEGKKDYAWVSYVEEREVDAENLRALAQGAIAEALIQVYRALGGGWETPVATSSTVSGSGLRPDAGQVPQPAGSQQVTDETPANP